MAKIASKTDPGRKKGSKASKTYQGKPVQPTKVIFRHGGSKNYSYMTAETEGGDVINDKDGMPVRWDSI